VAGAVVVVSAGVVVVSASVVVVAAGVVVVSRAVVVVSKGVVDPLDADVIVPVVVLAVVGDSVVNVVGVMLIPKKQ